jgi:DNA adenine methylase
LDATALERQKRRLTRLQTARVKRSTVFVHDDCRFALEALRSYLTEATNAKLLYSIVEYLNKTTSAVATEAGPQYGLFRYPGGKSWLIPEIKSWIASLSKEPSIFVEPFAGGAIAGLTVAAEGLAPKVLLSEIDLDISSVWKTVFGERSADLQWLCEQLQEFEIGADAVNELLGSRPANHRERAFKTIVRNRVSRGGVMTAGAGLLNQGEKGKGLTSRWYPETLVERIQTLRQLRHRIAFEQSDALNVISRFSGDPDAVFFIDPPYTAGGNHAGRRLYTHSEVDHKALFRLTASVAGRAMLTYHDVPEVRALARRHKFEVREISMKTTHHRVQNELLILK